MSHCNLPSSTPNTNGYTPISCGYYDHLEAFATLKTEVMLAFVTEHDPKPATVQGRVIDLFSSNQMEFMLFQAGETLHEVRLDRVVKIDGIPNPSFVSSIP